MHVTSRVLEVDRKACAVEMFEQGEQGDGAREGMERDVRASSDSC